VSVPEVVTLEPWSISFPIPVLQVTSFRPLLSVRPAFSPFSRVTESEPFPFGIAPGSPTLGEGFLDSANQSLGVFSSYRKRLVLVLFTFFLFRCLLEVTSSKSLSSFDLLVGGSFSYSFCRVFRDAARPMFGAASIRNDMSGTYISLYPSLVPFRPDCENLTTPSSFSVFSPRYTYTRPLVRLFFRVESHSLTNFCLPYVPF